MSVGKILGFTAFLLFGVIGIAALFKEGKSTKHVEASAAASPLEIDLDQAVQATPVWNPPPVEEKKIAVASGELPDADRIAEFFNRGEPKLPIVETIVYRSRVNWLKGRPAWLSDYAAHYQTSRHFIARSLNGKADYFKQDIAEGDKFNVLRQDKNYEFHLLIDTSRCKMWFYYVDKDHKDEKVLLKTYTVGLGRPDPSKTSGLLTPHGTYSLGDKIAIYKPKVMGFHNGKKIEMVQTFGTRWIPFEKEIADASMPAKGLGIHGVPWPTGEAEDVTSLGKYESDGCIRMATGDVEELFSIIITKPTTVQLVKDYYSAK